MISPVQGIVSRQNVITLCPKSHQYVETNFSIVAHVSMYYTYNVMSISSRWTSNRVLSLSLSLLWHVIDICTVNLLDKLRYNKKSYNFDPTKMAIVKYEYDNDSASFVAYIRGHDLWCGPRII